MKLCTGTMMATAFIYGAGEASAVSPDEIYSTYETYNGEDLELVVNESGTHFTLWSPKADTARVLIYDTGRNSAPTDTLSMTRSKNGTWRVSVPEQLYGKYLNMTGNGSTRLRVYGPKL